MPPSGPAVLALGFRPFYLAAAMFAALAVPVWYAAYRGWLVTGHALPAVAWHSHEMLFGFAPAVIAGFLLAAVRNWTNLPTPTGAGLAGLIAVWLAGRITMLTGPAGFALLIDVAFLPLLAVLLAHPIWRSRNHRNLFVPLILMLLAIANLAFHLAYRDVVPIGIAPVAVRAAADTLACLMAVIAGRVIPAFAGNAIKNLAPRRWPLLEVMAIGSLVLIVVLEIASRWWALPPATASALFIAAAALHVVRVAGWKPWAMRRDLLLVVLPIAYAWIPCYLLLRGLLANPAVPGMDLPALALHALVIGAMGGLMLAMMTRSALGHTGRPLVAGWPEALMYLAIHGAAIARALLPLAWPTVHSFWVGVSSLLWTVAFATFAISYWPILTRARVDGQPG